MKKTREKNSKNYLEVFSLEVGPEALDNLAPGQLLVLLCPDNGGEGGGQRHRFRQSVHLLRAAVFGRRRLFGLRGSGHDVCVCVCVRVRGGGRDRTGMMDRGWVGIYTPPPPHLPPEGGLTVVP
jgi:hypothetical protein